MKVKMFDESGREVKLWCCTGSPCRFASCYAYTKEEAFEVFKNSSYFQDHWYAKLANLPVGTAMKDKTRALTIDDVFEEPEIEIGEIFNETY